MSIRQPEEPFEIDSGGLRLEARLRRGDAGIALVLHPHPMYGGDMDNHVVTAVCETLAEAGATTLRFNFRGAGRSDGAHDGGTGELDDAAAAVATLRELQPQSPAVPLLLAGYSFGAAIAARLASPASGIQPAALVLISPPVGMMTLPDLDPTMPALLISGIDDHIAPASALEPFESDHHRVVAVPGVDHGWWPGIDTLTTELRSFIAAHGPWRSSAPA